MPERLQAYVTDEWIYLVIAMIAVIVILKIFKSVVRWLLICAVVAAIAYFAVTYEDGKWVEQGKQWVQDAAGQTKEQAISGILNEVRGARYTLNADGTYEVKTTNFTLRGTVGASDAVIVFQDREFPVQLNDALRQLIEQAQANSK